MPMAVYRFPAFCKIIWEASTGSRRPNCRSNNNSCKSFHFKEISTMQNVTGDTTAGTTMDTTTSTADTSRLESEVRNTMAQGNNVRQEVRDLTVRALSTQNQDRESLRHVMTAVMKGVREGAQQKLQQTPAD